MGIIRPVISLMTAFCMINGLISSLGELNWLTTILVTLFFASSFSPIFHSGARPGTKHDK